MDRDSGIEALEIDLLTEGIYRQYGYDFRDYARSSLKRRIQKQMDREGCLTVSGLQERVLHDPACMDRLLLDLSVNVSEFFRNPGFFKVIRETVVPFLKTYPFVRIWHAGSASGEEVYALAILLHEEGIYKKCRIYATDMNPESLENAKSGAFPLNRMKTYTQNYQKSGGTVAFSDYYSARYNRAIFKSFLKENLVFARHNLVTDASFNEFNLILCRNVMIYFNKALQDNTHIKLYQSLSQWGVLGLGEKEHFDETPCADRYEVLSRRYKLFRKVR